MPIETNFDRLIGALHGLPDVLSTKPTTIRTITPLIGVAQTFILQTYRQSDKGDTIFLECVSDEQTFRVAIPPSVAQAIARQREALTDKSRKKAAKAAAADRKARGIQPAFTRKASRLSVEEARQIRAASEAKAI